MAHAYPGLDLLDPGVSPRRIWVLASRLPPAARLPGEPWSDEAHLLALLADRVAELTWVTVRAAGGKATRPRPLPRPQPRPDPGGYDRAPPAGPGAPGASGRRGEGRRPLAEAFAELAGVPGVRVNGDG